MKRFEPLWPKAKGSRSGDEPPTVLHLFWVPEWVQIAPLAQPVRRVIDRFNAQYGQVLSPVEPQAIHATVQQIWGPAADINQKTRLALQAQLTAAFSCVPAFDVVLGQAIAGQVGVLAHAAPEAEFNRLIECARGVIGRVCGEASLELDSRPAHVSFAYATGNSESGPLADALNRVRPDRTRLRVNRLRLVEVSLDAVNNIWSWPEPPVATFDLLDSQP